MNDSIILSRRATFRAATKGMRAYTIALVMNSIRRGYDWRGCSKCELCEVFADGELSSVSGQELRRLLSAAKPS